MTTALTARDKVLLVVLAVFLLVAGGFWFGVRPLMAEIEEVQEELATSKTAEQALRYKIGRIDSLKKALTERAALLRADGALWYPMMESHGVDELLTGMALDAGLAVSDLRELSIGEAGAAVLRPFRNSAGAASNLTGLYAVDCTFILTGTREELQGFLDILVADVSLRVGSFTWSGSAEKADWTLSLKLTVFLSDAESLAASSEELLVQ